MKTKKQIAEQQQIAEIAPVKICGFRQNVFRRDSVGCARIPTNPSKTQEKYTSLERKMFNNGYCEALVEKDYPINSESVSSLAEGADYRNDPAQAIAQAPKRVNLGDVTEAQAFLNNPQYAASLFADVKAKLNAYYSSITKENEKSKENEQGVEQ